MPDEPLPESPPDLSEESSRRPVAFTDAMIRSCQCKRVDAAILDQNKV